MKNCKNCKFCDLDYIFDEQNGEEYPFYGCLKGNDVSLDFECEDFEEQEQTPYIEKDTKCDKSEHLEECKIENREEFEKFCKIWKEIHTCEAKSQ